VAASSIHRPQEELRLSRRDVVSGDDALKPALALSGGESARLFSAA
jgi:hypothetical protein